MGEAPFRARQLWQWLWQKRERDFGRMTNISKELRTRLAEAGRIGWPGLVKTRCSRDGTTKFLVALEDGQHIETVLIPEKDHFTLCLSTQVGCALGCTFCATGRMGLIRNLTMAEILGQSRSQSGDMLLGHEDLAQDLRHGQVADQPHPTSGAKRASQGATDLGGET